VVATTAVPTVAVPTATTAPRATETPVVSTLDPATFDPATLDPVTRAAVDDFLTTAYGGEPFQGAVLVARGGEILMRQGLGMADHAAGLANGPDTRFRLGSLTKPFTAIAILKLHAQGKLALDAPICPYLDPCPAAWQPITVHDLLAHTSGIPDFAALPDFAQFKVEATTPAQTIARVANRPLDFAPGSGWQYSNSNYIILGAILEKITGQSYASFIEEQIFAPLGMVNSGYERDDDDHSDGQTAQGYQPNGDPAAYIDMSVSFAAGALYSTVDDLFRFDRALYTDQLLPQELMTRMFTIQAVIDSSDPQIGYGYGWVIVDDPAGVPPGKVISHAGTIDGFTSAMLRFPDLDAVVIVLSNVEGRDPNLVVRGLVEQLIIAP